VDDSNAAPCCRELLVGMSSSEGLAPQSYIVHTRSSQTPPSIGRSDDAFVGTH
jgi:hypothetical protein